MRYAYSVLLSTLMFTACDSKMMSTTCDSTLMVPACEASPKVSYIIMADPNAPSSGLESSGLAWMTFVRDVMKAINNYTADAKPPFGIVNGDITEFGKPYQRDLFDVVYDQLDIPFYIGMGDQDYQKNINQCSFSGATNPNACAYSAVSNMESTIDRYSREAYSKKLRDFRADKFRYSESLTKGSMAYSWDHKTPYNTTNHFVQLHLAPTYSVVITESNQYEILDSLSFLRDDLDQARRRGVDNIFLNFHALEWIDKATTKEQRILKAILSEYRVSAVFVGHTKEPEVRRHLVFGIVPIFTTGALHLGYFDSLTVTKNSFEVTTYKVKNGQPELFKRRFEVLKPAPPPQCYEPGEHVSPHKGQFIRTKFIKDYEKQYYLRQIKTRNVLDANENGEVIMHELVKNDHRRWEFIAYKSGGIKAYEPDTGNSHRQWKFRFLKSDASDNKYYEIIHQSSGRRLDGGREWGIDTTWFYDSDIQYWRIIKYTSGARVQLQNYGNDRMLDADDSGHVFTAPEPLQLTDDYEDWEVLDVSGKPIPNVRYFEPISEDSWKHRVPSGTASDTYWKFLGERALDFAAPCIWNGLI